MRKRKSTVKLFLIGLLLGVTGCSSETVKDNAGNVSQPAKQPEKSAEEKPIVKEEPKPVVVNVIDPNTKEIVKTFIPEEMGLNTDKEAYKKELAAWAKELARGKDGAPGYDQKMILDKIDASGQIIKGQPKIILDESELVDKVMEASVSGGDVLLPIYVTESGYKPEDIPVLGEVVLASYTTYFNSGIIGRSKNIELSGMAIDNIILGEGDTFSFNHTVGPRTAERGYQKAPEIVNKEMVEGIGGGICQTSSTLFNAIDKVGVKYIEWHHHSLSIGYVPAGRDATVSWGGKDFQFQNTTGVPLLIKTIYGKGKITIEIRTSASYQTLYVQGN
jgi:vancomycin resistance protein YoaR